jgi:hypothetical protein
MTVASTVDLICPPEIGEQRIKLNLKHPDSKILAHIAFPVTIDWSRTLPVGLSLPLEVIVQGPVAGQRERRLYRTTIPDLIMVTPKSGGRHLLLVRELYHNRWQGQLFFDAEGDAPSLGETR